MSEEEDPLGTLLRCLELEPLDRDLYLGDPGPGEGRLFGGMVAAQSVMAATRTLEDARPIHSLHAYFLRPGRHELPLRFVVDRIRDGKTFNTRRVAAHQGGEAIFSLQASFAHPEEGIAHQDPMPDAADPETLPDWEQLRAKSFPVPPGLHRSAVELRLCDEWRYDDPDARHEPRQRCWMRVNGGPLPADPAIHSALLVYLTDRMLLSTAARAHGLPFGRGMAASLDHAVWFHRPLRLDDSWLLYASESPAAFAARAIIFGGIFARTGERLASVAQEALIRRPRPR